MAFRGCLNSVCSGWAACIFLAALAFRVMEIHCLLHRLTILFAYHNYLQIARDKHSRMRPEITRTKCQKEDVLWVNVSSEFHHGIKRTHPIGNPQSSRTRSTISENNSATPCPNNNFLTNTSHEAHRHQHQPPRPNHLART